MQNDGRYCHFSFQLKRYFKMSPLMVLAGMAGAQNSTPRLNALREASGSNIGALGYAVPYVMP